jgi:outer membrane cobalamin receptor
MIPKRFALVSILAICLSFPPFAQAQDSSNETFELGEVVVTAPKASADAISATTTITAEQIKQAGHRTLDETLTRLAGLHIRTAGRGIPRVDFRGLRTRQLIVLLNGVPIASPWDNQFDPSFIPVENIAKIKVTRGPSSVLYGDGGNAGIINVITKKGRSGLHGSIAGQGGQHDEYLGRASVSQGGERVNLFASGSYFTRNDYPLPDSFDSTELETGDTRTNSDREQYNFFTNLMYSPDEATTMALTFDVKEAEYGVPPDTVSDLFTNKKPDKLSKLNYRRMDDKNAVSGQFSVSHNFQSPFSVRGWAYYNSVEEEDNDYTDISFDELKKSEDRDTRRYGGNLQTSLDLESLGTATLALKAERSDIDSTLEDFDKDKLTDTDEHVYTYSSSLEYRVNPVDPLGLVLGGGWHWQDRTEGRDEDDASWLAGAYYDLPTNTRLKGSVARKIRFPDLRRLYEDKAGNPDLKAESTLHYQAGLEQRFPSISTVFELTGFRIEAEDFIEKDETLSPEQNRNFEEYRFQGLEVALVNRSLENLVLRGSYTYLDAENKSSGALFETLEHRPENKVTLQAAYSFLKHYMVHLDYLWLDERQHYSKGKEGGEFLIGTLDDYHVVDLRLSGAFLDDSLEISVGARNLFDEEYAESYSLVMPGRQVYAGVEYRF